MEERPGGAEGGDDPGGVASVLEIAPRAPRHQYFDARLAILLNEQRATAALGTASRGQQTGRTRADDHYVVHAVRVVGWTHGASIWAGHAKGSASLVSWSGRAFCGQWTGAGSNRRHMDFQSIALPTELPVPSRQ